MKRKQTFYIVYKLYNNTSKEIYEYMYIVHNVVNITQRYNIERGGMYKKYI